MMSRKDRKGVKTKRQNEEGRIQGTRRKEERWKDVCVDGGEILEVEWVRQEGRKY